MSGEVPENEGLKTRKRGMGSKVLPMLLVAIGVYIAMMAYFGFKDSATALRGFEFMMIPAMLLLASAGYLLRYLKWTYLNRVAGVSVPARDGAYIFLSGMSMVVTPGKVGELWKGWLIKARTGAPLSRTLPPIVADRLTDFAGLVIVSLIGIGYYWEGLYVLAPLAALLMIGVAITRSRRLVIRLVSWILGKVKRRYVEPEDVADGMRTVMGAKGLVPSTALSVAVWTLESMCLWLILQGFGISLDPVLCLFIFSFSSLVGAISFMPGGIGLADGAIAALLVHFMKLMPAAPELAVIGTIAFGASLLSRAGTLWFGAGIGLAAHTVLKSRFPTLVAPETDIVEDSPQSASSANAEHVKL